MGKLPSIELAVNLAAATEAARTIRLAVAALSIAELLEWFGLEPTDRGRAQ